MNLLVIKEPKKSTEKVISILQNEFWTG